MSSYTATIGIDLGDRQSHLTVLSEDGVVRLRTQVRTRAADIEAFFADLGPCRVVMEACTHSPWVSALLEGMGFEVIVANPRKLHLIFAANDKTDVRDSERLARLGRADVELLSPIKHRSEASQRALIKIKVRDGLVAQRTRGINQVRSLVKSFGVRIRSTNTAHFTTVAREQLDEDMKADLEELLDAIDDLTGRIRRLDRQIEELCRVVYPETALLREVPGVGPITALTYVLTIDDPDRFRDSRTVPAYLGLVPRRDQSGQQDRQLSITKAGSGLLRRLLVQAANYILGPFGPDTDLRRWGLRLAERGGPRARKVAKVAVARKLAVLLHRLWSTGAVYEPLRSAA